MGYFFLFIVMINFWILKLLKLESLIVDKVFNRVLYYLIESIILLFSFQSINNGNFDYSSTIFMMFIGITALESKLLYQD